MGRSTAASTHPVEGLTQGMARQPARVMGHESRELLDGRSVNFSSSDRVRTCRAGEERAKVSGASARYDPRAVAEPDGLHKCPCHGIRHRDEPRLAATPDHRDHVVRDNSCCRSRPIPTRQSHRRAGFNGSSTLLRVEPPRVGIHAQQLVRVEQAKRAVGRVNRRVLPSTSRKPDRQQEQTARHCSGDHRKEMST